MKLRFFVITMAGQIKEIVAKFTVDDTDFEFQIADDRAVLTAKGVKVKLTTAEWLAVADIAHKLIGGPPPRRSNVGARWTAEMDAELIHKWGERMSISDIAGAMGRSDYAITLRLARNLGIEIPALYAENKKRGTRAESTAPDAENSRGPDVGARWTPKMDAELLHQWVDKRVSLDHIAARLGQSEYDVALRLTQRLGIELIAICAESAKREKNPHRPNDGAGWTPEMDAELLYQWNENRTSLDVVAVVLGRSVYGVASRLSNHLGVQLPSLYAENEIRSNPEFEGHKTPVCTEV